MISADFFKNSISDNNGYQGIGVRTIDLNSDFITSTSGYRYKEHYRKKDIVTFVQAVSDKLASKTLKEFGLSSISFGEEYDANLNQSVFEIRGRSFEDITIYTGNIVGSVVYKGQPFNINCRFGNTFLQYMIASSSGFIELENLGSIDTSDGLGEWILRYYWKLKLKRAFSKGMYKTYQKKQANLSTVRGTIDVNRFIRKPFFDGKTFCDYKEHSFKNEINAVIGLAINRVFNSPYSPLVSDIYEIKRAFDSIGIQNHSLVNRSKNSRILNPYFNAYEEVYQLSLRILKDESVNVGQSNKEFSAFLFDISLLFEHHVRTVLKSKFSLFKKNKEEYGIPDGISQRNLFPDVVIDLGGKRVAVYDVKYKHFRFEGKDPGVNREDRFQLTSYVATHLNDYEVVECGIIYPIDDANDKKESLDVQFLKVANQEIPFKIRFYHVANDILNQRSKDLQFLNEFNFEPLALPAV